MLKLSTVHWHSMCFSFFYLHPFSSVLVACLLPFALVIDKVCNLHLLLRASLGAKQVTVLHLSFFHFLLPQNLVFPFFCIEDYYSHSASLLTCTKIIFVLFLLMFFFLSHFGWILRYFTGLLLSPSTPSLLLSLP